MIRRLLALAVLVLCTIAVRAANITVTGTGDTTAVDGVCTLREAVLAANLNTAFDTCTAGSPGLDTIRFNIGGGGVQTIVTAGGLSLTEPTIVDGTTQPGYAGTPLINIRSGVLPPFAPSSGFEIGVNAGGSTIRGIAIGEFQYAIGIRSSNNTIAANYIGLDASGLLPLTTALGVFILGEEPVSITGNVIGGVAAADRNFIAANTSAAIAAAFVAPGNVIRGNTIGLNVAGGTMNTGDGVDLQGGGGTIITDNLIAGLVGGGVNILASNGNVVQRNIIGTQTAPNGNRAVSLSSANDNVIGAAVSGGPDGNTFAYSTFGAGVEVISGTGNSILTNSIFANATMGIELRPIGPTPNDACDADTGANELQNRPSILRAVRTATSTTIVATLESTPASAFTLEFFANTPPGDQAQTYLGHATLNTDATCNGIVTFTMPSALALDTNITATATDANDNTSEISRPIAVTEALEVTKSFIPAQSAALVPVRLEITIHNPRTSAALATSFTDTYPANLVNAGAASATCAGTVIAPLDGNFVQFTGGTIPAGGTCTITAIVRATQAGTYVNDIPAGAVTALLTQNAVPASATLIAGPQPAGVPTLSQLASFALAVALALIALAKTS